jgi:nicotinamidase-related amidase
MAATDPVHALLVVDMQRGLLVGPQAVPDAGTLCDRVSLLVRRARQAGAVVVHLQNDGAPGSPDERHTPGWEMQLSTGDDVVVNKDTDDGFAGTPLGGLLAARQVARVAICGVLSEMCVSATARGALARGLAVVLPHDGHATYDLDGIPAAVVARVAEHALGDEVQVAATADDIAFTGRPVVDLGL